LKIALLFAILATLLVHNLWMDSRCGAVLVVAACDEARRVAPYVDAVVFIFSIPIGLLIDMIIARIVENRRKKQGRS
jgi:hypothetical protein